MRKKMTNGHSASMFRNVAPDHKAWEQLADGSFQVEQTALIQQHGCRRGRNDLSQAGDVVKSLRKNRVQVFVFAFIGEVAEGIRE